MLKKVRFLPVEIKLSEPAEGKTPASNVQVIRTGKFKHPSYGNFTITREHLDAFVKNFNEKVRGIDIAVDYKHDSEAEAAGWFKSLEVKDLEGGEFGLFADVDWTEVGNAKLSKKEFRYLSADFTLRYKDPENNSKDHGPVLLGAGLTNRPFIKGMEPVVQLSEQTQGVNAMTPEQMMAKIAELEAKIAAMGGQEAEFSAMKKQLSDYKAKEDAAAAKEKEDAAGKVLAEKKAAFDKMLSEGNAVEAQRVPFMAGDVMKFAELQGEIKTKKLSETKGGDKGDETVEKDASDQILSLAEKLVADKKATDLDKAVSMVLADPEHKKLRDEHEKQFN